MNKYCKYCSNEGRASARGTTPGASGIPDGDVTPGVCGMPPQLGVVSTSPPPATRAGGASCHCGLGLGLRLDSEVVESGVGLLGAAELSP